MCRREISSEFLNHPQLVNGIEDICNTKSTDDGYQWFYEGRNGMLILFSFELVIFICFISSMFTHFTNYKGVGGLMIAEAIKK